MNEYVKLLKEKGLKITPQRLEIIRYLDLNRTHPDADTIYTELKKSNPSLSRTTVYNTLDILNQQGLIRELTISRSEMRYDFETRPHHHFLCGKCGEIMDIYVKCPYLDTKELGGNHIEEIHGYFKGTCKNCC